MRANRNTIQLRLKRRKIPARVSDLRGYYQFYEEIFERVGSRVSARANIVNHLYAKLVNPAWVRGLQNRALEGEDNFCE